MHGQVTRRVVVAARWLGRAARYVAGQVRRKIMALWAGLPGPWPVKVVLVALAVAEPGPFGEMALGAFVAWRMARQARHNR